MLAELLYCNIKVVLRNVLVIVVHHPVIAERAIVHLVPCLGSLILLKDLGKDFFWKGTLVYALRMFDKCRSGFGAGITDATSPFFPMGS